MHCFAESEAVIGTLTAIEARCRFLLTARFEDIHPLNVARWPFVFFIPVGQQAMILLMQVRLSILLQGTHT